MQNLSSDSAINNTVETPSHKNGLPGEEIKNNMPGCRYHFHVNRLIPPFPPSQPVHIITRLASANVLFNFVKKGAQEQLPRQHCLRFTNFFEGKVITRWIDQLMLRHSVGGDSEAPMPDGITWQRLRKFNAMHDAVLNLAKQKIPKFFFFLKQSIL